MISSHFSPCAFIIRFVQLLSFVNFSVAKIEEGLFTSDARRDVIVSFGSMRELEDISLQVQNKFASSTKEDRIHALYQALNGHSSKCQASAQSYLDSGGFTSRGMWSSNSIMVKEADLACVNTLARLKDVSFISADKELPLIDPIINTEPIVSRRTKAGSTLDEENTIPSPFFTGMTWGLSVMRVKEAWSYNAAGYGYGYGKTELKTGKGIVVASIDTGVNSEHERLKDNHRSFEGWFDGYGLATKAEDDNGHGTHTMGTMVGTGGIGVAPGAQWISCRGCKDSGCLISALLRCCQWILCPHDPDKAEPDDYTNCYTAPDLVSNSWGGGQGDKTFERCALALRAAGIVPIWAIGNSGPECETASSPGDLESVIAVGATDPDDNLAQFSSRGPTVDSGHLKPDVSAPGVSVTSSWIKAPDAYVTISGTSMATPHVAGLVALMLERCRLPYNALLDVLQSTAERSALGVSNQICGATKSTDFPNNFFGFGRVNALEAVKKVVQICHFNRRNEYGHGHGHPGRPMVGYSAAPPYQRHNYGYLLNYYSLYSPQRYGYANVRFPYRRGY